MRKLVVPSWFAAAGVFCRLGVGDGEREGDERLRDVRGVASTLPRGVRCISPRFVGLWPSFAKTVMSGISEKALKHVSSTLFVSSGGIIALRMSRPAWNSDAFCDGVRWKVVPRLRDLGVVAPLLLLLLLSDVFIGDADTLRVDGGGMRLASLLLRLWLLDDRVRSGVDCFFGDSIPISCGMFSLSSKTL